MRIIGTGLPWVWKGGAMTHVERGSVNLKRRLCLREMGVCDP